MGRIGQDRFLFLRVVKQHDVDLLAFAQRVLRAMQVSLVERHELSAVKSDLIHVYLRFFACHFCYYILFLSARQPKKRNFPLPLKQKCVILYAIPRTRKDLP